MDFAEEQRVRQRVTAIYNQARGDFATDREYNDYLEEVEDMIFNLVTKTEVAATEAKMRAYAAAHADRILAARVHKAEQDREANSVRNESMRPDMPPPPPPPLLPPPSLSVLPASEEPSHRQQSIYQPVPVVVPLPRPNVGSGNAVVHGARQGNVAPANSPHAERQIERRAAYAGGFTDAVKRDRAIYDAFTSIAVEMQDLVLSASIDGDDRLK